MRQVIIHTVTIAGGALTLAGCSIADSRSPVPEFMRGKASEAPPDVKQLARERLDSVFGEAPCAGPALINDALTIPLELNPRAHGIFQSFR